MSFFNFLQDFTSKHRTCDATHKMVFDHHFFELKYYLHKEASIEDFAILLNIGDQQLAEISNNYYNVTFQMLINENRYKHFLQELESPLNANLTIESIVKLCGYENNDRFVEYVNEKIKKG